MVMPITQKRVLVAATADTSTAGAGRDALPVAVIGAGPSGLAAMRAVSKRGLGVVGFEAHNDVGGLWNIANPDSTVYESAHLISSRTTTEFAEFPMHGGTPDYPGHRHLLRYFRNYAAHFGLTGRIRFGTRVTAAVPTDDGGWQLSWQGPDGAGSGRFGAVVVASGTLHTPYLPSFAGEFTGDPARFGFPKPDYRIYESHPVVNSLILHHLGHGDLSVKPDIERLEGSTVHFRDGTQGQYDLLLCATGYVLSYPFLSRDLLGWAGASPQLYLNILSRQARNLMVVGMVEASGLGWEGRYRQAELVAAYLAAQQDNPTAAAAFDAAVRGPSPDVTGGYRYLGLDRMSYYVNKDAYRAELEAHLSRFAGTSAHADRAPVEVQQ